MQAPAASPWRLGAKVASILLSAWGAWTLWRYYGEPGYAPIWSLWPRLLPDLTEWRAAALVRELGLLARLSWLIFWGWGLGRLALRAARIEDKDPAGAFCLELGAGLGLTGLVLLVLGLLGLWNAPAITGVLAAATLVLAADVWRRPPDFALKSAMPRGPWETLFACILALFAAFNLLGAFMPEIFYDALTYHLALPDLYWRRGGIVPTPENLYSGLPLLVQMLYALCLLVGGDGTARLLHWSLGVFSCLLIHRLCARLAAGAEGRLAGLLGALVFYSLPVVGVLSWKSGVELGWTFFQLLAFYAAVSRLTLAPDRRWTALAGFMAGLAMGTKYQAWPMVFIMAAALTRTLAAAELGLFAGMAALTASPWIVKNVLLYGNPLYPLFEAAGPRWRAFLADGGGRDLGAVLTSWAGMKAWLLHPWTLTYQAGDLNSMGPLLLLGLPLLFLFRFSGGAWRFLWLSVLGLWGCWSLTTTLPRYLVPHVAPAAVLFAGAFERGLGDGAKAVLRCALAVVFCGNLFWLTSWFKTYGAEGPVLGTQTAADYLSAAHPSYARPAYAGIEFVNKALPKDARVLFLGEARSFYCERDRVSPTVFDGSVIAELLSGSRDGAEVAGRLRGRGFTHVLVNVNELAVWNLAPAFLPLAPRERRVFEEFLNQLKPVFERRAGATPDFSEPWVIVYELAPRPV